MLNVNGAAIEPVYGRNVGGLLLQSFLWWQRRSHDHQRSSISPPLHWTLFQVRNWCCMCWASQHYALHLVILRLLFHFRWCHPILSPAVQRPARMVTILGPLKNEGVDRVGDRTVIAIPSINEVWECDWKKKKTERTYGESGKPRRVKQKWTFMLIERYCAFWNFPLAPSFQ